MDDLRHLSGGTVGGGGRSEAGVVISKDKAMVVERSSGCDKTFVIRNMLKTSALMLFAIALFISMVLLYTGKFGRLDNSAEAIKTPSFREMTAARYTMTHILNDRASGMILSYKDTDKRLDVVVDITGWKRLSYNEQRGFIKNLASLRLTMGKNPMVKIMDTKSVEHGSFENNRTTLTSFDF